MAEQRNALLEDQRDLVVDALGDLLVRHDVSPPGLGPYPES